MSKATMQAAPLPATVEKLVQNAEAKPSVSDAVAGHDAVMEIKYDGWRTIWKVDDDGKARFYTRKGKELTGSWPAVEAMLSEALPPGTVLDDEAVVMETVNGLRVPKGSHAITSILGSGTAKAALASGQLTLVLFDLIAHGPVDARALPFGKRRSALEAVVENAGWDLERVMLAPHLDPTEENHEALLERGYEGSMVKWLDAPYKSGARGWGWFKLKGEADVDVIVTGYKPGESGWTGMVGAIEFAQFTADGLLAPRGRCSGIDFATRVAITKNPDAYLGRVFTMRHNGLEAKSKEYPHGAFRHPRFKTWRPDKPAEAVTLHDA